MKVDEGQKLVISPSPHIASGRTTSALMLDVLIALMPALGIAVYLFGVRALLVCLISTASCVGFEYAYRKLMKLPQSINDFSACITGILLAFCLPVTTPYWAVVIGAAFAILVAKQIYGGLGKNFMNPALAGRVFLFSFPVIMTTWAKPLSKIGVWNAADAVTAATPMASLHRGMLPEGISLAQMFVGRIGGSLGEVSALALILGGGYLVLRKVISLRIPLFYIGTVALLAFLFPCGNPPVEWMLYQVLGGGLLLGAIFMATDYVTSPVTARGQVFYAVGCGILTILIRYFSSYPEGVSFAILIMNACAWLMDRVGVSRRFGSGGGLALRPGGGRK